MDKQENRLEKRIAIAFAIGWVLGTFLFMALRLDETVSAILGALFGFGAVFLVIKVQGVRNKAEEAERQRAEEEAMRQLTQNIESGTWLFPVESFYKKFTGKFGEIDSPDLKESTYQRAKMIAEEILKECKVPQQYFERYTGRNTIERYFAEIWRRKQEEVLQANRNKLSQLRSSEAVLEKEYVRYADLIGREKSISYCEKQIADCESTLFLCGQQAKNVKQGAQATYSLNKGKESSWAVHGGIASGIAGGAAGVATAVEVERKNAEIRQQNAQLAQSVAHMTIAQMDTIWDREITAEESKEKWKKNLERAKVLLTEQLDETALLERLSPSVKSITISETGAVHLEVAVCPAQGLVIYDDVAAVIDGSIKAIIKVNGQTVGTAICVLPFNGVPYKCVVSGICLQPTKQSKTYQIEFAPNHLWAAEKM